MTMRLRCALLLSLGLAVRMGLYPIRIEGRLRWRISPHEYKEISIYLYEEIF